MNIIERAGRQLGLNPGKSVVERAAERLAGGGGDAVPLRADSAQQHAPTTLRERRETRREITLDFERLRASGFALPGDQSGLAEELRLIKRPLLAAAFSHGGPADHPNLIMITSANPYEGKTFTATNLAFSMASEHEVHVLLIDADVANPTIPDVMGFEAEMGLIDVVSDSSIDLADVLIKTNIENFTILPSGRSRRGTSELLSSARMARFMGDIAKRYADRIVIIDSPPVLARSEPMVLAKYAGQVVFVVEAERTSRAAVTEALALIGTKLGGVILNKTPPTSGHGYGHYYGYGSR